MAKIMTVAEAIESITAKKNVKGSVVLNRFSKKNFNNLMVAIANDVNFTDKIAKKAGDSFELEDIMVTKEFRKWCRKLVEKAGVDSYESEVVMTDNFKIEDMTPLYDFFASALFKYIEAGNKFDLHTHENFEGSIFIKEMAEEKKVYPARNPSTGESLGNYESVTKKHNKLHVKSGAPDWLKSKRKIS